MRMPENSRSLRPCQAASDTKALEAAARAQLNRHKAYAEGCRFRKNSSKIPVATSHKLLCKRILHGRRIRLRPGAVPGQARLPFWTATHGPITPPGHPRSSSPAPVSTRPCAASKFRAETAGSSGTLAGRLLKLRDSLAGDLSQSACGAFWRNDKHACRSVKPSFVKPHVASPRTDRPAHVAATASRQHSPNLRNQYRVLSMSPTHHSPVPHQKSISPLEAAARTTLESIADRRLTDGEWRQMRSRLLQFAHLLCQWSRPAPSTDRGEPIAFPHYTGDAQNRLKEAA